MSSMSGSGSERRTLGCGVQASLTVSDMGISVAPVFLPGATLRPISAWHVTLSARQSLMSWQSTLASREILHCYKPA